MSLFGHIIAIGFSVGIVVTATICTVRCEEDYREIIKKLKG